MLSGSRSDRPRPAGDVSTGPFVAKRQGYPASETVKRKGRWEGADGEPAAEDPEFRITRRQPNDVRTTPAGMNVLSGSPTDGEINRMTPNGELVFYNREDREERRAHALLLCCGAKATLGDSGTGTRYDSGARSWATSATEASSLTHEGDRTQASRHLRPNPASV